MNSVQLIFEPHPDQPGRIDFMPQTAYDWSGSILAVSGGIYAVHFADAFKGFYELQMAWPMLNGSEFLSVDEAKQHVQTTYDSLLKSILQ